MGTPGDKLPVDKVVPSVPDHSSHPQSDEATNSPLAVTDMTILQNVPSLGIFIEPPDLGSASHISLQTLEDLEKQLLLDSTNTPESSDNSSSLVETLTAATDEFFEHATTTSSCSSQESPAFLSIPSSNVVTSFADLSLPGPSGLQTPKTKPELSTPVKIAPKRSKKPSSSLQTPKKPYICQICEKIFQTSAKLQQHQLIHSGGTPFKCEHCKKSFSSKFKLVRHVLIHSDRKAFSCTVCERTFHRKDHLKNHIKVHSPSKKVYTCEKVNCKKEYTSIMSYRKHLALHAAEEGSLECKICLKLFETKADILYHLKIHAGSRTVKNPNEKKFTCDYCDRKFFTRKDVRRHLVVHTGTRNFLCQFCPQRFGRKDHLVRHIKKSHSNSFTELETTEPTSFDVTDKSESSSFSEIKTEIKIELPQLELEILNYPDSEEKEIKLEEIPDVQNILFSRSFTELSPLLCSESSQLQQFDQLPTRLPSDSELLIELDVMKEELEGSTAGTSSLLEVEPQLRSSSLLEDPQLRLSSSLEIESPHGTSGLLDVEPQLRTSSMLDIEPQLPTSSLLEVEPELRTSSLLELPEMMDSDLLRLISEQNQLTEDENNLPLPGFSQVFKQQEPQPPS